MTTPSRIYRVKADVHYTKTSQRPGGATEKFILRTDYDCHVLACSVPNAVCIAQGHLATINAPCEVHSFDVSDCSLIASADWWQGAGK